MGMATTAAEAGTLEVTVADKEGIVYEERLLKPGSVHTVPREAAERWAASGRARIRQVYRYLAISAVVVAGRVADRGEVLEMPDPAPEYVMKTGKLVELKPGESPPDPLPIDHTDKMWWTQGPMLRVEALVAGALGGGRADRIGDIVNMRESAAVDAEVYGKVRVIDPLTAAGVPYSKALSAWRASGAVARPDYLEHSRPLRRAAERAAAAAAQEDAGPWLEVRYIARRPAELAGKPRRQGDEFSAPESAIAEALIDGRVEPLDRPSRRLRGYVEEVEKYRALARDFPDDDHKFPTY